MPKYRNPSTGEIWDSDTGQITSPSLMLNVPVKQLRDDVPTQEWLNSTQTQTAQKQYSIPQKILGAGESMLSLGTGATGGLLGMTTGAIEGILESIKSGKYGTQEGVRMAEESAKRRAGQFTYSPRTEAGSEYVRETGEMLAPLSTIPPMQAELGMLSTATRQAATMPRALPGAQAAIPAIERTSEAVRPIVQVAKPYAQQATQAVKQIGERLTPNTQYKKIIAEQLQAGKTDNRLAQYMLKGSKATKDPLYKEAVKQGFDEGVIAAIKGASPQDREIMRKMVNVMERGKENSLFAMKNRPTDIVGDNLLKRINFIKSQNRDAASKLDSAANSLKNKRVDFSDPVNKFVSSLDDMGIKIGDDLKPIYSGSDIEGLQGPQSVINNIVKRLSSGEKGDIPSAYDVHRIKRFIDENVTYGKDGEGLKGRSLGIVKELRRDLDNLLDNNFPNYNKVNTKYSDTINALDAIQDVAGRKMDLFGPNADKAVGTLLRRLMSNAQSRVNLVDAIDNIGDISKKYGGKFTDNIDVQMLLADELDNVFGPVARSSLAGETAKAFRKGADITTGQRTMYGAATDAAAGAVEGLRGINEKNAFKVINNILSR